MNEKHICCICGKEFIGWGNNPYPITDEEDEVCCDECNYSEVLPARIEQLRQMKGE